MRLGGHDVIPLDVRIISATHKNLATLSGDDQFRQDLYYRLLGLPIEIPPLRQRGNDKILLAKFFVDEFCRENDMDPKTLSSEAKQMLSSYRLSRQHQGAKSNYGAGLRNVQPRCN